MLCLGHGTRRIHSKHVKLARVVEGTVLEYCIEIVICNQD